MPLMLISGDAFLTLDLLTGQPVCPQVPYRYFNDDDAMARRAVGMLTEISRFTMLAGHGWPWSGPIGEAIEAAGVGTR